MRFFCVACLFGVLVASLSLLTDNWTTPLFRGQNEIATNSVSSTSPASTNDVEALLPLTFVNNNVNELASDPLRLTSASN